MKNLREKINNLLKGLFVDRDKDGGWGTDKKTDKLLSLFKQQMKEMVPKKKKYLSYNHNIYEEIENKREIEGFNKAIDQLLKNIEEL